MRHKTCLVAPNILDQYGVPYQRVIQQERDIIIVFPYAYHSGFNHGFNIAESTNFALERWVEYGKRVRPCDCNRARVNFSMDPFVKKYQPEKYDDWMNGKDIAPHPEDPPEVVEEIRLQIENPEEYARQVQERLEKQMKAEEAKRKRKKANEAKKTEDTYVYKHKDHLDVEVEIDAREEKVIKGLDSLKNALNIEVNEEVVKEMIDNGDLFQHAIRRGLKRKSQYSEHQIIKEETAVDMYKHIDLEGVHFTADPKTWNLTCDMNEKTADFVQESGMSLKELYEIGVFSKIGDCIMVVEKLDKSASQCSKKLKLEKKSKENCDVYWHKDNNSLIKIDPDTMKPIDKLPEMEKNVQELIDEVHICFIHLFFTLNLCTQNIYVVPI